MIPPWSRTVHRLVDNGETATTATETEAEDDDHDTSRTVINFATKVGIAA